MYGISIIGPGRLGGALALALDANGWNVESLVYRSDAGRASDIRDAMVSSRPRLIGGREMDKIESPLILIAAPDPEIEGIAEGLVTSLEHSPIVLHTSGSLSSGVLSPLRSRGSAVGSMHPLVSVSDAFLGAARFAKSYFCVEGDETAAAAGISVARSLGAEPFSIATDCKPLYHAAAVTASGHVVTVIDAAIELLSACGLDETAAREILMPLVQSTVENLRTQTTSRALTGTFARGDAAALDRHIAAMSTDALRDAAAIYLAVAERSIAIAERQGIDAGRAAEMRERISIAKRKLG